MSNKPGFFIQRTIDKKLISVFETLCVENETYVFSISFTFGTNDSITFNKTDDFNLISENEDISELMKGSSFIINRITVTLKERSIKFVRGELLPDSSPLFDRIEFENDNHYNNPQIQAIELADTTKKIQISKFLQSKLSSLSNPKFISTNLPKEYEALLSQHNSMLSKLEELNSELLIKNHQKNQELEHEYIQKLGSLEDTHNQKI